MNILNKINLGVTHYIKMGNDFYFGLPSKKYKKLDPGIYTINMNKSGEVYLSPMQAVTDTLIRLPDFTSEQVINEVEKFWSKETHDKFIKHELVYKRGIILHGLPGVGKSACVAQIMEAEVKAGGIVFFCPSPNNLTRCIKAIREIQGNIRCLVVWEEFDDALQRDESSYLSLLDGEMQVDNVVYLATTNYLDRIPNRFKKRPSRFASIIEVGTPNEVTRRIYIQTKGKNSDKIDVEKWVKATKGLTIDHIKDLIISVVCLDVSFEDSLDRLKEFSYDQEKDDENIKKQLERKFGDSLFDKELFNLTFNRGDSNNEY